MSENIKNKLAMRSYEKLKEEEKEQIKIKLSSLDYTNPVSILQFCSESRNNVTAISTEIISRLKNNYFEYIQKLIIGLIENLETIQPQTLFKTKRKILFRKFVSKNEEEKVISVLSKIITIEETIDEVEDKLLSAKLAVMADMECWFQMIKKTYEYTKKQEIEYIAIQESLKKANAEKENLQELIMQNAEDSEYSYELLGINKAIKHLQIKASNLLEFRNATLELLAQIGKVQAIDEQRVSKIEEVITNIMPSWKRNFTTALEKYAKNNAVAMEKIISHMTNKFLIDTAIKNVVEKSSIDFKTLEQVNTELRESLEGLNMLQEEVKQVRQNTINVVKKYALQL